MSVQSVIFDKKEWTPEKARSWLVAHDYKTDFKPMHETKSKLRFRQFAPDGGNYITKKIDKGVQLIIEFLREYKKEKPKKPIKEKKITTS